MAASASRFSTWCKLGFAEWTRARGYLLPAMVEDPEDEVVARLLNGTAQLWLGERCAMVTEVINDPRTLHVWLAGGDLKEIVSLTPGIAAWGRMMGCTEATINGRRGWARVLKTHGFEGEGVLRKDLHG